MSFVIGKTENEVRRIAEPLVDKILDAWTQCDYQKFIAPMDPDAEKTIPQEAFELLVNTSRENDGEYVYRDFVGCYAKTDCCIVVWVLKFSNTREDTLIQLSITPKNDTCYVTKVLVT